MVEYINVKVHEEFKERFEALNKKHNLGYTSLAEIVKEFLRKRFEEIETTYSKK